MFGGLLSRFVLLLGFRAIVLGEEALPMWPTRTALINRFKGLFTDNKGISPKARVILALRAVGYLAMQALFTVLWTIDDIIFYAYRATKIVNPVFIVGGFRTGSTSLHRVLALDEEKYVSPRFLELALPFLTIHYLLDFGEYLDEKAGTSIIKFVEKMLQSGAGPDVLARHPMAYYHAEEDDVLLAINQWTGYYTVAVYPYSDQWETVGAITKYPKMEQHHIVKFYERALQKVLFRRGNGRALLSKSHLIDCMQLFDDHFEGAKFINIARHPKEVFTSWYALAQSAALVFSGWQMAKKDAVEAHLKFWDVYLQKEVDFFINNKNENRVILQFKPFIKQQLATMKGLYEGWGIEFDDTPFHKRLEEEQKSQQNYKKEHKYTNPTLEELDLDDETVSERYKDYVAAIGF